MPKCHLRKNIIALASSQDRIPQGALPSSQCSASDTKSTVSVISQSCTRFDTHCNSVNRKCQGGKANLPVTRRSKSRIEHCSLVPLSSLCPTRDREASGFAAFAMAGVPSEDEITFIFIPVGDDFFLTFDPFHIFSSSEESSDRMRQNVGAMKLNARTEGALGKLSGSAVKSESSSKDTSSSRQEAGLA